MSEKPYQFRNTLEEIHKKDRRDRSLTPEAGEVVIHDFYEIVTGEEPSALVLRAAGDLAEYLFVSMDVPVRICRKASGREGGVILLEMDRSLDTPGSYTVSVSPGKIVIAGADDRGISQGVFYLEDLMNLRSAPFLKECEPLLRKPLFSPRMIHSGLGMDLFNEKYLWHAAHYGYDAVLVYMKSLTESHNGKTDFNALIRQAAQAGLDVYLYSALHNEMHPSDPGAEAFYDGLYGEIFRQYPGVKGIIFVGESCQFPSHDPHTTMTIKRGTTYGIPATKPSPGWWPCEDFPEFFAMLSKVIRKEKPDADIVLWTYNWGSAPEEDRVKLLEKIGQDITVEATFEMYDNIRVLSTSERVLDYSISNPGPGKYFQSEGAAAAKRNLKLYTMSNTGGRTWDCGVVPYIPCPQQWIKRFKGLHACRENWNLSGLMETHHYGWQPSIISELAKWSFWSNSPTEEEMLYKLAERDFSKESAADVVEAWNQWSHAVSEFITPIEDQYGPCRVGPSYPFIFSPDILRTMHGKFMKFPSYPGAHFGGNIVTAWYRPVEDSRGLEIGVRRTLKEIKALPSIIECWHKGVLLLEKAFETLPERKKESALKMIALGKFMRNTMKTVLHIKKWWYANSRLVLAQEESEAMTLLSELEGILHGEIANVKDTMEVIKADSALGFEPSMDYMTDQWHLEWKLRQVESVLTYDIPSYRDAWKNNLP